jgi:hypothetical protein
VGVGSSVQRRTRNVLALVCAIWAGAACSGGTPDPEPDPTRASVSSIQQPPSSTAPTSNATTGTGPRSTAPTGAPPPPDYGESETPYLGPPAVPPQTTTPESAAIEASAKTFVDGYWRPRPGTTFGQLAAHLAAVTTERFRAQWLDPALASTPVPVPITVVDERVQVTRTEGPSATVAVSATVNGRSLWRTLELARDDTGSWRVDGMR